MTITAKESNAQIILEVEGRVDTNTSPQLQNEILKAFQTTRHLILDFSKVPYLSSAGLRALLIGQKTASSKKSVMELVSPTPVVLSVLNSVGFDKVLTIR